MDIGLIGLGKMGFHLALNMRDHGHKVTAYDISPEAVARIEKEGIKGSSSLEALMQGLEKRRVLWLMIPAGAPVDGMLDQLVPLLDQGDILIDGGNSHYKDTLRRAEALSEAGIHFMDVGTSGGTDGARNGVCTMIGAEDEVFQVLKPLFESISVPGGYLHTGGVGSGHFVKMVHNGIEYGMMQAIGEGFEILRESRFDLNFGEIAEMWNHGSVIRGWLMELTASLFRKDPSLEGLRGVVRSSGEGLWTVQEALELKVAAPVITESLFARFRSEKEDTFTGKVVAGLRNEFGGHGFEKK